ncbi:MAG: hypothetical protein IKG25_11050, partial [Mogibacterium sp.]|nr:hypothetical protein [Mogibacterium sp.]
MPGFEIVADEGSDMPGYDALGNKFIFTYSNGKTEEYICRTYNINNSEGYIGYKYFEKNTNEVMNDVYTTANGDADGVFKLGIDNTVSFYTGNACTKEFPVRVDPAPAALEFIPAAGVTLWAEEGAFNIDDDAFFAVGNTFNVTYTDGSKKTFVCEKEPLRRPGKTEYYTRYFEKNKSHTDANGVFLDMDFYYDYDVPDDGFLIGDNPVRFHVRGVDGDVFTESYYNVTGKPEDCTKHKLRKVKAIKATCQKPGVKAHYECSVCHKIFSDKKGKKETTLAKLATMKAKHIFKKKTVSDEYLKSPATCTKKATYYYACKTCGEKGKKTFTAGKALGHKYEQAITKATPAKNGSIGQKCTVCGKKGKGKVIPRASKIAIVKKYKKKGVPASVI